MVGNYTSIGKGGRGVNQAHIILPKKLESLRSRPMKSHNPIATGVILNRHKQSFLLHLLASDQFPAFMRICESARTTGRRVKCHFTVYRVIPIKDQDNLDTAVNKLIVDGWVKKKFLADDTTKHVVVECKQEKCDHKSQERVEAIVEMEGDK